MQTFSSDGVEIAFVDAPAAGEDRGEPILLIHGFASSAAVNWIDPGWVKTLTGAGRRTVVIDNRGHGASAKLYDPAAYAPPTMAADARRMLEHLDIDRADVMGYSMGARIAAFLALEEPTLVRSLVFGGLGHHLVEGVGLPMKIAEAMEADRVEDLADPMQRLFRTFADNNKSDRRALAACIRGSRATLGPDAAAEIGAPTLIAIGTKDTVAGDPYALADILPDAKVLEIPGRDHNLAVGDKVYKKGVLDFLAARR